MTLRDILAAPPARLHTRLALALLLLFALTGIAYASLALWSTGRYREELTQRLNAHLAEYMARQRTLVTLGHVNRPAMDALAREVMSINPNVEVYLLGPDGRILDHALPADAVVRDRVATAPIERLLDGSARPPVRGDDPRDAAQRRVFSAARVDFGDGRRGYLYAVLGGQKYRALSDSIRSSHVLAMSILGIATIVLFGSFAGLMSFHWLTRPLRRLGTELERFQRDELRLAVGATDATGDEIAALDSGFAAMRARIRDLLATLSATDRQRRELVANISHDLRSPLTSMQGYLETLQAKAGTLRAEERNRYLDIAARHCARLSRLVDELSELARLDAGDAVPHLEVFPLAELVQDIVQKFALAAGARGIDLGAEHADAPLAVRADIGLIERVLENLIDNALEHTPPGGRVRIALSPSDDVVRVTVEDSGPGIRPGDMPRIFERHYTRPPSGPCAPDRAHTGLGLPIVKRILELHGSDITVTSPPGTGTRFVFRLERA